MGRVQSLAVRAIRLGCPIFVEGSSRVVTARALPYSPVSVAREWTRGAPCAHFAAGGGYPGIARAFSKGPAAEATAAPDASPDSEGDLVATSNRWYQLGVVLLCGFVGLHLYPKTMNTMVDGSIQLGLRARDRVMQRTAASRLATAASNRGLWERLIGGGAVEALTRLAREGGDDAETVGPAVGALAALAQSAEGRQAMHEARSSEVLLAVQERGCFGPDSHPDIHSHVVLALERLRT